MTLIELALGIYPFPKENSPFKMLRVGFDMVGFDMVGFDMLASYYFFHFVGFLLLHSMNISE